MGPARRSRSSESRDLYISLCELSVIRKKEKISVFLITTAHMYGTIYAYEAVYVYMHRRVHLCF